jgi:hypothetical protein
VELALVVGHVVGVTHGHCVVPHARAVIQDLRATRVDDNLHVLSLPDVLTVHFAQAGVDKLAIERFNRGLVLVHPLQRDAQVVAVVAVQRSFVQVEHQRHGLGGP